MTCLTGCDERAVNGLRTVVFRRPSCEIGQHAAGFVHQKVGGCKVPVMAAARGQSGVERPLRHTCQTQGKRMNFRLGERAFREG